MLSEFRFTSRLIACWLLLLFSPQAVGFLIPQLTRLSHPQHFPVSTEPLIFPLLLSQKNVGEASQPENLRLISTSPPIWTSIQPILSPEECEQLQNDAPDVDNQNPALKLLQQRLDSLIGRSPDANVVLPRLLVYDDVDSDQNFDIVEDVLPYGLHVDTADDGGNHSRRYISALVYLTDSKSAATIFPLAVQRESSSQEDCTSDEALRAAQSLLDADVQHTQIATSDEDEATAAVLEKAAWQLYHDDTSKSSSRSREVGIRILPRQGHCALLSFVQPDGSTDPRSWHSSEGLHVGDAKSVLTFFFELDVSDDGTPASALTTAEFGKRAQDRIHHMVHDTIDN